MAPKYHPIPPRAIRIPVPDTTQQTDYTCGASALQAVCKYYGVGPDDEPDFVADMRMPRSGSDPEHIIRGARRYRLRYREYFPMSRAQLLDCLNRRRPVTLMLQAWGESVDGRRRRGYKTVWGDGHWVVAIGYTRRGVLFEDPSLQAVRGFLSYRELDLRWHDWGPKKIHMDHYGLAVWKPRARRSVYETRAERIG